MSKPQEGRQPRLEEYLELVHSNRGAFADADGGFRIVTDPVRIAAVEKEVSQRLRHAGLPSEWSTVGVLFEDQYILLLRDAVVFPDDAVGTYIRFLSKTGIGVAVLPIHQDKIVLVRHFRHATRSWHLEIPRGFGSPGQAPEVSARRELEEEIGAEGIELAALGQTYPNNGLGADAVELFVATVESVGRPETHEAISEILELDVQATEDLIRQRDLTDPFAAAAFLRARLDGLLPDQPGQNLPRERQP